jgi:RimJ/RimL family protein N-acetyltransferase
MDERQRIVCAREPHPSPAPAFVIVRGELSCAWAARADVPEGVAVELNRWASEEPGSGVWAEPLVHGDRYTALLGGRIRSGPAFVFPEMLEERGETVVVTDEAELRHHFAGWVVGEINTGRGPVVGVREGGEVVSICFCARRSERAAEAGVETAKAFRGRGFASRVVIAWARRIQAEGLMPMYSTDWGNRASLGVARKLGLVPFAVDFNVDA